MSPATLIVDLVVRYGFQLLGALVILVVGLLFATWAGRVTDRWLARRATEPPMRVLMVRTARIIVLMFALVVALDKFGFQVAPLVAGIGVVGLGIGIALQGVLGNVVAGLSIIFTKPFRVGEYIELLGVQGVVTTIELFSTTLAHPDRSRVVIPNRKVVGEILHNYGTIRQLDLTVGVGYGADLGEALNVAGDVVAKNPRVLREPAPVVAIAGLGEVAVRLAIKPWVSVADYGAAQGELYEAIVEKFRASEIPIPLPQREIRLLNGGLTRLTDS